MTIRREIAGLLKIAVVVATMLFGAWWIHREVEPHLARFGSGSVHVDAATSTLVYDGPLTQQSVDRARNMIGPSIAQVKVRSTGGDEQAAIQFATLVNEKRLAVEIWDYCIGACAVYVAVAAHEVRAIKGSILACGPNALGEALLLRKEINNGDMSGDLGLAAQAARLYAAASVDPTYALNCVYNSKPVCWRRSSEKPAEVELEYLKRYWIPRTKDLDSAGVQLREPANLLAAPTSRQLKFMGADLARVSEFSAISSSSILSLFPLEERSCSTFGRNAPKRS